MKYSRFEELPVWRDAQSLAQRVHDLTEGPAFRGQSSLRDQLERAVISIGNNIAEGFERGTTKELINFLYIARGSAGEVRSMLCFLADRPGFSNFKSEISNLKSQPESISRQLRGWADSLQNSKIKGPKFLTEKEASAFKRRKEREENLKELRGEFPPSSFGGKAAQ